MSDEIPKNLPMVVNVIEPMRITLSRTTKAGGKMVIGVTENGKPQPNLFENDLISIGNLRFANIISRMLSSKLWFRKETLDGGTYTQTTLEWIGGDAFNLKGR